MSTIISACNAIPFAFPLHIFGKTRGRRDGGIDAGGTNAGNGYYRGISGKMLGAALGRLGAYNEERTLADAGYCVASMSHTLMIPFNGVTRIRHILAALELATDLVLGGVTPTNLGLGGGDGGGDDGGGGGGPEVDNQLCAFLKSVQDAKVASTGFVTTLGKPREMKLATILATNDWLAYRDVAKELGKHLLDLATKKQPENGFNWYAFCEPNGVRDNFQEGEYLSNVMLTAEQLSRVRIIAKSLVAFHSFIGLNHLMISKVVKYTENGPGCPETNEMQSSANNAARAAKAAAEAAANAADAASAAEHTLVAASVPTAESAPGAAGSAAEVDLERYLSIDDAADSTIVFLQDVVQQVADSASEDASENAVLIEVLEVMLAVVQDRTPTS